MRGPGFALGLALLAPGPPAAAAEPSLLTRAVCEARVRERPADLDSYRCYRLLARQNRAAEAEAALNALLAGDPANHRARYVLARIGGDQGRDGAEALYRQATAGFAAEGDAEGEVHARLGLCLFFNRRHRLADFEAELAAAARTAEASGDAVLRAWVEIEKAQLAFRKGDYGTARRLYKQVEAEAFPDGPLELQAQCLGGLAGVAQETGQTESSVEYIRRAADLCHRQGDFYDEARHRGNLVLSGFRLSIQGRMEPEQIVALAQQALEAARAGGNRGTEARAHLYLGDLLPGLEGRAHYREGLAISRETKETAGLILGLRGLALNLVEHEPRDAPAAYRLADEVLALARGSNWYTALARLARARMRWITGPRGTAVADSLSALDAVEAMRDLQDDGVVRARVFSLWAFAYDRLAGQLLNGPDPSPEERALAFAIAERKRSRVLLDELDAAQATGVLAPTGPTRERRAKLLAALSRTQRRLSDPTLAAEERRAALVELERLETEESGLRAEMARAHPAYGALRQPRIPSLEEVQRALGADEALIAFQVASRRNVDNRTTEHGSWAWAITREASRAYPIPDQDELRPEVALFLGLLERRDGAEAAGAVQLYDELLAPALSDLPASVTRLVLVPDGVLHRTPFAVLRPAESAPPLGVRYAVSTVPSATLWLRWRRAARGGSAEPALLLADPELPARGDPPAPERAAAWAHASPTGRLPHARGEARFVARVLGRGSLLLSGPQATEHFLKQQDLTRFGVLHFATHALLDEEHPERSAVLLAPGAPGEDGLLQVRDVVGLRLDGRLVVLSACRSAGGTLLEGEGVMGLARGFFQAGAHAVVGSLWPLRDDEAETIVRGLYRHLARGEGVAAALAAARREQVQAGAPAAAWAGLMVLGDGDLVPFPGGREPDGFAPGPLTLAGGALAAGLLGALVVSRRRKRAR